MMNLKSLLNANEDGAQSRKPSLPAPRQQPPSTPIQTVLPQSFRDYSNTVQASPGRSLSVHDYAVTQHTPTAYGSPPPLPGASVSYGTRPAPPQLQPVAGSDIRSPNSASVSGPSPYRHTPNGSVSGGSSGGYPFPPSQPPPASSPVLHHQHTPSNPYSASRDGYGQPVIPQAVAGAPDTSSYLQGRQPPQQASPISAPNNSLPFYHQRSQSAQSTPTPTSSVQSQQPLHPSPRPPPQQPLPQYAAPYSQGSPVLSHRAPPLQQQQQPQHYQQTPFEPSRLPSQPPTPLGPPLSGAQQRTASVGGHYAQQSQPQPASPLQQPMTSVPTPYTPYHTAVPQLIRSPSLSLSSTAIPNSHDHKPTNQQPAERQRRSISQSDRAQSVSVSPKTRVPSLPGSASGQPADSELNQSPLQHLKQPSAVGKPVTAATSTTGPPSTLMEVEYKNNGSSAKRKLESRDLNPDELDRIQSRRPPPFKDANRPAISQTSVPLPHNTLNLEEPVRQKQTRHKEVPVWARRYEGGFLNAPNFIVRKPAGSVHVNGKQGTGGVASLASRHTSRQTSPEAARVSSAAQVSVAVPQPTANESRIALLGPWEESITGEKPYEELTRKVADFLYVNVVSNPNMAEIQSLGVQFEIEAKLGTLISRDTNQRVSLPVDSECILQDTGRISFRSSMTEVQHKAYNEFLNELVFDTDARNPVNAGRSKPRVPIVYKHRHEIDKFYELPMQLQDRLPPCVRNLIPHRHTVKVRVTYDKKTNEVLAKIVKARISDLNIFFPECPLDCRISVNLEMTWEGSLDEIEKIAASTNRDRQPDREKDRLSYSQSHYQVDLTQVTYKVQGPNKMERDEKEHELEIELAPGVTIEHGKRAAKNELHAYQELVDGFIDNVRMLARRSKPL